MSSDTHVAAIIFFVPITAVFCVISLETEPRQYVIFGVYKEPLPPNDQNRGVQP